jgi:hypothetical protein
MCVTCLFEDHDVPLLSTKHVALCTNYSIEIAYHKQSIQHNQTNRQMKSVCLTISIYWDVMIERYGKDSWFVGYEAGSLVGKGQDDLRENWTRQSGIDEVFMLYQGI